MWIIGKESARQVSLEHVGSIECLFDNKVASIDLVAPTGSVIMTVVFDDIRDRDKAYERIMEALIIGTNYVSITDLK